MYVSVHVFICFMMVDMKDTVWKYVYTCILCAYIQIYISGYTHAYIHICIYMDLHENICVCVYAYLPLYTHTYRVVYVGR